LVRPLAGDERDRLRDSLRDGYDPLHPIVVTPGGEIVDGRNRRDLCVELELPAVVVERTFASDAELARFVVAMNLARRHLDQRERRELAGRLVVNGTSTRQAARTTGVSKATAQRAAAEVRASGVSSETPARSSGSDGKSYPATRPSRNGDFRSRELSDEHRRQALVVDVTLCVADAVRYLDRPVRDAEKVAAMFNPDEAGIGREDWTIERFDRALAFLGVLRDTLVETRQPSDERAGRDASTKPVSLVGGSLAK
jgi:ParB-like chromosome segregation protein Spo0J